jgi:hypothetical protein
VTEARIGQISRHFQIRIRTRNKPSIGFEENVLAQHHTRACLFATEMLDGLETASDELTQ